MDSPLAERHTHRILFASTTVFALAVFTLARWPQPNPTELSTAQGGATPTETPDPLFTPESTQTPSDSAIFTEGDAIARSLSIFPGTPGTPVARLLSHGFVNQSWFQETNTSEGWDPTHPVWLVGIQGHQLTVATVAASDAILRVHDDDSRAAEGMFFMWDANSGMLTSEGALMAGNPHRSLQLLGALATMDIPIMTATPLPLE